MAGTLLSCVVPGTSVCKGVSEAAKDARNAVQARLVRRFDEPFKRAIRGIALVSCFSDLQVPQTLPVSSRIWPSRAKEQRTTAILFAAAVFDPSFRAAVQATSPVEQSVIKGKCAERKLQLDAWMCQRTHLGPFCESPAPAPRIPADIPPIPPPPVRQVSERPSKARRRAKTPRRGRTEGEPEMPSS